jgi:hypothetical protein
VRSEHFCVYVYSTSWELFFYSLTYETNIIQFDQSELLLAIGDYEQRRATLYCIETFTQRVVSC